MMSFEILSRGRRAPTGKSSGPSGLMKRLSETRAELVGFDDSTLSFGWPLRWDFGYEIGCSRREAELRRLAFPSWSLGTRVIGVSEIPQAKTKKVS